MSFAIFRAQKWIDVFVKLVTLIAIALQLGACMNQEGSDESMGLIASDAIARMLDMSRSGDSLYTVRELGNSVQLECPAILSLVESKPDYTSYHLLFYIKFKFPDEYNKIPLEIRSRILCSMLARSSLMDDWGFLGNSPQTYLAGEMLVDTGDSALPYLYSLLENKADAFVSGSSSSTYSRVCHFRRCDYAYRYICIITHAYYVFEKDINIRDTLIDEMRENKKKL